MGVRVTPRCINWSQPSISRSSSLTTLSSLISSPPPIRRSLIIRSRMFGNKIIRSRSCETLTFPKRSLKRIRSANFDSGCLNEDQDSTELRETELALVFQSSDDDDVIDNSDEYHDVSETEFTNWYGDMIPASIERKANSVNLPFSLRIIQKKKQWEEGMREVGEFAYCSMKKAFSSMVFIIRELQSYTLQLREVLFVEDLQGILMRVQKEMNASFVWLFQQVFSHTPNLMVCVMILLANYSVYSMSNHVAVAASLGPVTVESVSMVVDQTESRFDSSTIKSYSVNSGGKTTSIGGINGGGGKSRPVSSGTDGDGMFEGDIEHQTIVPDGASSSTVNPATTGEESVSSQVSEAEELDLWESMVVEAEKMREVAVDAGLDHETMGRFVSPVTVKMEEEVDTGKYMKTELIYQMGLFEEPNNPLLLANYAQFLYLFYHDHTRAEEYFKKASKIEPKDADALFKYASFLWHAKNDLWAAEENFLEAISADPKNPFYGATYAHFLWSNGGDDTCFPLDSRKNVKSDEG